MSESIDGRFAAAAGCMDGRTWPAIQEFAQKELGVTNVDIVASEPGFVAKAAQRVSRRLLSKFAISATFHHATDLIVFGHEQCAGNPVVNELHERQTLLAGRRLQQALPHIAIYPVFVERRIYADGTKWVARRLLDRKDKVPTSFVQSEMIHET